MKLYVLRENDHLLNDQWSSERIRAVLERVVAGTDVSDLVVAVYLVRGSAAWAGEYVPDELGPTDLHHRSNGDWRFVESFALPDDLPKQFKLIRMVFGTSARYPKTTVDRYGWRERFERFEDHVANLFAHELHHYRRYHLGLHLGEGEQAACKWALMRAKEAGFLVEGQRMRRRRRKPQKAKRVPSKKNPDLVQRAKQRLSHLAVDDLQEVAAWIEDRISRLETRAEKGRMRTHFDALRSLVDGSLVRITRDDTRTSPYIGQTAVKDVALADGLA